MSYKIPSKKKHKIPSEQYFREREVRELKKRYHGKLPPFKVITREGTKYALNIQGKTHREGEMINYDSRPARIIKVSKKGVYIQRYTSNKGFFEQTTKKPTFIKEKEFEKKAYPFFVRETAQILVK